MSPNAKAGTGYRRRAPGPRSAAGDLPAAGDLSAVGTRPPGSNTGLEVEQLSVGYHGVPVVREATLHVAPGELVAVLGPNGAGKTTLLSALGGLLSPQRGTVRVGGRDVTGLDAHLRARQGIRLVPEGRALFPSLTVREHLRLVRGRGHGGQESLVDMLPELGKCLDRRVGLLSGGEQQMLAIGRALISSPTVLLVDEMSLGLAPVVVQRLLPLLRHAAENLDTAVLFVEQHVSLALTAADRAYVLDRGRIVLSGDAQDLLEQRDVMTSSYLGGGTVRNDDAEGPR